MGSVRVQAVGKAYKRYPTRWSRLAEWLLPASKPRHEDVWVLRDVTFEVARGDAVGVIGANGAGKSTLLKIITGTTQPTAGRVELEGRVAALLELGMGFHPDFTGRQNAFMAGQLLGLGQHQVAELMPQIEAFADIGHYIDQPVRIYSSGMQVRLAFSVATAVRPDLLIVDEALSVGDAHFQHKSFNRIREFREQGTTLLLVSHDLAAVRSICNRAVWLDRGEMRAHGATRDVVDAYSASVYGQRQDIGAGRAFEPDAARWGRGGARITSAVLEDAQGRPLGWLMGGEAARVVVRVQAQSDLDAPMVGFLVKDRTGQPLFGDNTFATYRDAPLKLRAGDEAEARFEFRMPVLPHGTYALAIAVASGTQQDHVVEEWADTALFFESHNTESVQGMIGIPMQSIQLDTVRAASRA